MKATINLIFDRRKKTIEYNGAVIIDIRRVKGKAKARLFSRSENDICGYTTVFSILQEDKPFDLGFMSLSTKGLVTAVIENRLEIEGMQVSGDIEDAYRNIWPTDRNRYRIPACRKASESASC